VSAFFFFKKVVVDYLAMLKTNAVGNSSSKPILFHPSNPRMSLIGKLMGYMLKYYKNNDLFLVCVISMRGRQKRQKCMANAHSGVCLHIFTSSFQPSQTTKVCRVRFLGLQKNGSVRFFHLYKFVVSAF